MGPCQGPKVPELASPHDSNIVGSQHCVLEPLRRLTGPGNHGLITRQEPLRLQLTTSTQSATVCWLCFCDVMCYSWSCLRPCVYLLFSRCVGWLVESRIQVLLKSSSPLRTQKLLCELNWILIDCCHFPSYPHPTSWLRMYLVKCKICSCRLFFGNYITHYFLLLLQALWHGTVFS